MDGALASAQRVTRANEHEERTRAGCSLSLTAIWLDCGTRTANCGDTELGWYKDTPSPTLLFVFMQWQSHTPSSLAEKTLLGAHFNLARTLDDGS